MTSLKIIISFLLLISISYSLPITPFHKNKINGICIKDNNNIISFNKSLITTKKKISNIIIFNEIIKFIIYIIFMSYFISILL